MRGIANEDDATSVPPIQLQPFDCTAMDLFIIRQAG